MNVHINLKIRTDTCDVRSKKTKMKPKVKQTKQMKWMGGEYYENPKKQSRTQAKPYPHTTSARKKDVPVIPVKPSEESSKKFLRFIPKRPATKVPMARPRVPTLNLRSSSMRALRFASRMARILSSSV